MSEHPDWTRQAKALLDESTQNLDAVTLSRLNRARQTAMANRRRPAPIWFLPAGLASACVVMLAVAVWHGHTPRPSDATRADMQTESIGNDTDTLTDDDDLYEDLDFYAWLDAQEPDPGH